MQIKTEEISLEELNNNVVEYVLKSPHNTNPAILRQMLNSRGVSGGSDLKKNIIFSISSSSGEDLGDEYTSNGDYLVNVITNETVSPEQLAKITLSGTGFVAQPNDDGMGVQIGGHRYSLSQILGFIISQGGMGITCMSAGWPSLSVIYITDMDYKQAYLDALMQEIS